MELIPDRDIKPTSCCYRGQHQQDQLRRPRMDVDPVGSHAVFGKPSAIPVSIPRGLTRRPFASANEQIITSGRRRSPTVSISRAK